TDCKMQFKLLALIATFALLSLTVHGDVATDTSTENIATVTATGSTLEDLGSNTHSRTPSIESDDDKEEEDEISETQPKSKTINLGEDDEDDDDDYEEGEGEEETCDTRISSIVRNFNSTPLLPDDYNEAYEAVTK